MGREAPELTPRQGMLGELRGESRSARTQGEALPVKDEIGVGLIGLGVVGGGVARALIEREEYFAKQVGARLVLRRADRKSVV